MDSKPDNDIIKKDIELIERMLKDPNFDYNTKKGLEEYKKKLETEGLVMNK